MQDNPIYVLKLLTVSYHIQGFLSSKLFLRSNIQKTALIFFQKEDILHNKTRVDHHEDEIRKLRARIDELKTKLTTAEDEVHTYKIDIKTTFTCARAKNFRFVKISGFLVFSVHGFVGFYTAQLDTEIATVYEAEF